MKIIINIDVPELAPAIEFYSKALGVQHTRTLDDDVAELSGASATLYLLLKSPGSKPAYGLHATRSYLRHWTPVHFDLVVDDAERAAARAVAAGARRETPSVHWKGSKCVSLADPFGHGFCFIEFAKAGTYAD